MAKQFNLGPIRNVRKLLTQISGNERDRDQNIQNIERSFRDLKQVNCELVICIMDSYWNELRPTIKLNGTVTYGKQTRNNREKNNAYIDLSRLTMKFVAH
jgi:hypothetical protein